jgi:hypothetical protein
MENYDWHWVADQYRIKVFPADDPIYSRDSQLTLQDLTTEFLDFELAATGGVGL